MRHIFVFDEGRCSACSACMIGCMDQNDIDLAVGEKCYRQTYDNEIPLADGSIYCAYISAACMHCADAPCIAACPAGCLFKDPDTGFTVYDNTDCIGCRSCAMACPFGAPGYRPSDGKMVKCDGCNERVKSGRKPACVRACSFGALTCVTEEEYDQNSNARACDTLIDRLGLRR